ncbi:hypothetical protein [Metabacillus halosaccharovorans]|uniref:DUF4030 domain-containing protein n=1 Tax=Metabacillus halosaccharovorans TaxID=930124 RepID=A0ABT3DKF0_9BACI|nr:hypothetical protein [Metabacillus halosaccharovorans]MCV9887127.1 hypothetical protein [Metabacillus halosaccharovorans]
MFKKILIIAGLLFVIVTSYSLLNKSLEAEKAIADKDVQEPLDTSEKDILSTLELVTENLGQKYQSFVVKATSKKELVIQVNADKDYFNSIYKEMESDAKSVIKSSPLKEYKVVVESLDFPSDIDAQKAREENSLIITTITDGLNNPTVIGDIMVNYQESINVHTNLDSNEQNTKRDAKEIEDKVKSLLISNELKSIVNHNSYVISVLDKKGKKLN